jgi:hypothetical protein
VLYVKKADSRFMSFLGWLLKPIAPHFMTHFWTTIGHTIYVPDRCLADWNTEVWFERHATIIEHEETHVVQCERWGMVLLTFLYLFFPLPFFFAWGRWRIEREAYMENIRAAETKFDRALTIDWVVNTLWSNYGWVWPKSWMRQWFEEQVYDEAR